MKKRKKTKKIKIGNIYIGGNSLISVQSMCNTDTRDVKATVKQIKELTKAGCEIVRVAVPDEKAVKVLGRIKKQISIPLVADIHFSADLAMEAINQGVDKIRINPGNIGSKEKVKMLADACKKKNIPIRIGVNIGSLEEDILKKHKGKATSKGMVESALKHIKILEDNNFYNIIVSLKASDIEKTIEAYQMLSKKVNYPFHLGITEAGTFLRGTVLSSVGLGILLNKGIGDTIRISLTDEPVKEVKVGIEILKSLNLRKKGISITSCPTCGRTEIDLVSLAKKVEKALEGIDKEIKVAVMGCVVNGLGEAKEADLAIVGGKGFGLITKAGKVIKRVEEKNLLKEFIKEVKKF